MCIMVYLACDGQLPTFDWNSEAPDFYVTELKETDYGYKQVRSILTKKYLYNIGAHSGCGCGFNYGTYELFDEVDRQEDIKGRNSVNKLLQYIENSLQNNECVELLTCLAGNEGISPIKSEIYLDQIILGDSFNFRSENELRFINGRKS